ncbi:hypothetical protein RAA17_12690 [Komagataeibacter rhaeticus]|nr:hypothetical protein [Komagataeibacter rhaeticus]
MRRSCRPSPLWSSALDSAREATALYTSLYETGPEQYRALLADSHYRLFVCLNGLEQIDRAMESLKLALVQYRHLAARRPQEFRAPLARCLLDLALYSRHLQTVRNRPADGT